jgi:hypothetical protein
VAATKYTSRYRLFRISRLSFQGDGHGLQAQYIIWFFYLGTGRKLDFSGVAFHNIHRQF